jgi:cysteine desulfurase family protein
VNSISAYLNNAATTYPKPPEVLAAVSRTLSELPAEPGRSGHGHDPVEQCREELAGLFQVADHHQIAILPSATYALNAVILGLLGEQPGLHVVTTALEHNSVLRPLEHLRHERGLHVSCVQPGTDGCVRPIDIAAEINCNTQLIAVTHASNVTGCLQPIAEIAEIAATVGIPLLIDASQSAGAVDLDYDRLPGRVFVAMAGHKGLYGPPGIGALIVPDKTLRQTVFGGTGVRSDSLLHPADLPLRHEAGTMNLPGIAGLCAGVRFVKKQGVDTLGQHRNRLVGILRARLHELPRCHLSPLANEDGRAGIVSFWLEDWLPDELGQVLYESFGIEVRAGLHCAPLAHASIGTVPLGNVRVSVGAWNTEQDIETLVGALDAITTSCAV